MVDLPPLGGRIDVDLNRFEIEAPGAGLWRFGRRYDRPVLSPAIEDRARVGGQLELVYVVEKLREALGLGESVTVERLLGRTAERRRVRPLVDQDVKLSEPARHQVGEVFGLERQRHDPSVDALCVDEGAADSRIGLCLHVGLAGQRQDGGGDVVAQHDHVEASGHERPLKGARKHAPTEFAKR